ncbi:hypothetical protein SPHINGO361_140226 [Sphingomonas sp. EC-HK361]|nr:hypothetical protein SPHINGO361_140226 [Sphingomonas sp. EC-HK361]
MDFFRVCGRRDPVAVSNDDHRGHRDGAEETGRVGAAHDCLLLPKKSVSANALGHCAHFVRHGPFDMTWMH